MANILGINLSELSASEVLTKIAAFLNSDKQHYLVTPNPEIILEAHRDEEFFYILNHADLALADGVGLKIAGYLQGENIPRLTGSDLTLELLAQANQEGIKILILNWEKGLSSASEISLALKKKYPQLNFLVLDTARDKFLTSELIEKINIFSPKILFSTFGFPYQEKNIYHNLDKLPSIKLALGVGGSFDFISKKIKRAPKIMRFFGLEWFWRLIKQPKRFKRIWRATIIFFLKALRSRLIYPWLYRPNVACLLYKKEQGINKILLVERVDEPGHWQLPQGGIDGQSLEEAGARELREEVGTDKFTTKGTFKNLYRYKFKHLDALTYPGEKNDCRQDSNQAARIETKKYKFDYQGQKQGLYVAEFFGQDSDLKICFWDHLAWKWVAADKLVEEVHPVRQEATKIFLAKFKSLNL